jgi:hypothetical protein
VPTLTYQARTLRVFVLLALTALSACTWFGAKKPPVPDPTELIVTGAPVGSMIFLDGVQQGDAVAVVTVPQILRVAPGAHIVEIRIGDPVVYREETDVAAGEKRIVTVLSGSNR